MNIIKKIFSSCAAGILLVLALNPIAEPSAATWPDTESVSSSSMQAGEMTEHAGFSQDVVTPHMEREFSDYSMETFNLRYGVRNDLLGELSEHNVNFVLSDFISSSISDSSAVGMLSYELWVLQSGWSNRNDYTCLAGNYNVWTNNGQGGAISNEVWQEETGNPNAYAGSAYIVAYGNSLNNPVSTSNPLLATVNNTDRPVCLVVRANENFDANRISFPLEITFNAISQPENADNAAGWSVEDSVTVVIYDEQLVAKEIFVICPS